MTTPFPSLFTSRAHHLLSSVNCITPLCLASYPGLFLWGRGLGTRLPCVLQHSSVLYHMLSVYCCTGSVLYCTMHTVYTHVSYMCICSTTCSIFHSVQYIVHVHKVLYCYRCCLWHHHSCLQRTAKLGTTQTEFVCLVSVARSAWNPAWEAEVGRSSWGKEMNERDIFNGKRECSLFLHV